MSTLIKIFLLLLIIDLPSISPLTFLLNKPLSYLCTHHDPLSPLPTVYSLLPPDLPQKFHTVGRLDAKTTGLLLITDDVGLVTYGTSGAVEKIYRATAMGALNATQFDTLREGVDLKGGLGNSDPCDVKMIKSERHNTVLEITLMQGKNRQIRRMLHEIGSGVLKLERTEIGGFRIDDLDLGEGDIKAVDEVELDLMIGYKANVKTR
ncbi:hypothetical protein TrLO_g2744 [Triparma laevis f. longispina]|uniref:Pseudouridine synthase RsuA/RluA-like domain-containing protein n=1 Tax=Triparma laevis f. longispina TaxID=1714387 RepID=A0A9W7CJR4_9STRA|nr:hypothetical protein TrLO_g2744 [Triparma laevis f. longispina]